MMLIKNIFATIVIILLTSIATAAPSVSATSKNDADATIKSQLRARTSTIKSESTMAHRTRSVAHPNQVTTAPFVGHHPSDSLETKPDPASMTTPPAANIKAEDEQRYLRGDDTSASEIIPSSPTTIMSNDEVVGYVKLFNSKGIPVHDYFAMKALASIDDADVPAHYYGVENYVWKCRWFLTILFEKAPHLSYGFGMETDTDMILDYVCGKEQEDDPTTVAPSPIPTISDPTVSPSRSPESSSPSQSPVTSSPTTSDPTVSPSRSPEASSPSQSPVTSSPTTSDPTVSPSRSPEASSPSKSPSLSPSQSPETSSPSKSPSLSPTSDPTVSPSRSPETSSPSKSPSLSPSHSPETSSPSKSPSLSPTSDLTYPGFASNDGGFRQLERNPRPDWKNLPCKPEGQNQTCALFDAIRDYYAQDCDSNSTCEFGQVWGHPIGSWCVGSVVNMQDLFDPNTPGGLPNNITLDLSGWDTSSAESMGDMFVGQTLFNGNLSLWDTSSVTSMTYMFRGASSFNSSSISNWNVTNVVYMGYMFYGATDFAQNLCPWKDAPAVLTGFTYNMFYDSSGQPNDGSGGFNDTAC